MAKKKIGETFYKEQKVKGLFEIRDAFSFQGSNIAQPGWYGLYNHEQEEKSDDRHLVDQDFDGQSGRSDVANAYGRDLEQDRDDRDDYEMDMEEMER